jgi:hypothetical protein
MLYTFRILSAEDIQICIFVQKTCFYKATSWSCLDRIKGVGVIINQNGNWFRELSFSPDRWI